MYDEGVILYYKVVSLVIITGPNNVNTRSRSAIACI